MTQPDPESAENALAGIPKVPDSIVESLEDYIENPSREALSGFLNGIAELSFSASQTHAGPLPTPTMLAQYEGVVPGLAERIVRIAERPHEALSIEQAHRHSLENREFDHAKLYRFVGLWMGFAVIAIALGAAIYCAFIGQWLGVGVFLSLPLMGVVSVFVTGRSDVSKDASANTPPSDGAGS